ncbi:MAG: hypothetical protein ACO223_11610, partial [Burkholderiaceae bacterium]
MTTDKSIGEWQCQATHLPSGHLVQAGRFERTVNLLDFDNPLHGIEKNGKISNYLACDIKFRTVCADTKNADSRKITIYRQLNGKKSLSQDKEILSRYCADCQYIHTIAGPTFNPAPPRRLNMLQKVASPGAFPNSQTIAAVDPDLWAA